MVHLPNKELQQLKEKRTKDEVPKEQRAEHKQVGDWKEKQSLMHVTRGGALIRGMTSPSLVMHRAAQAEGKRGPVIEGKDGTRYSPPKLGTRAGSCKITTVLPLDTHHPKPTENLLMCKMTSERGWYLAKDQEYHPSLPYSNQEE